MSRTKKGKKPSGFEYWGKRGSLRKRFNPHGALGYGKFAKKLTKRSERREKKDIIDEGFE